MIGYEQRGRFTMTNVQRFKKSKISYAGHIVQKSYLTN